MTSAAAGDVPVPDVELLAAAAADGRALLAAAQPDWSRPVPACPGWDAAQLVGHMGAILGWMATIVTTGKPVPRTDREVPPADVDALAAWYSAHLERTLGILAAAGADSQAWTFSSRGEQTVRWWRRRLAVELAIHRWDVQHAALGGGASAVQPIDGSVAAVGIEEFVTEFLPGLLAQPDVTGLTGTLHLHATDGDSEWQVNLDDKGSAVAIPGHGRADTAIRGSRSDLLLWLTNRARPDGLEIYGNHEVAAHWDQLRR